jgi:membrane-associated protein
MSSLLDPLLNLHGLAVYLLVAAVVFTEDALFVGFVVPGETAAVLGGVAASRGHASLALITVAVVAAAITGDSVGYQIGAHYGPRLLSTRLVGRHQGRVDAARALLARRGGPAVFGGRFVAYLRALVPFLAGVARLPYRRFLAYNAAGGLAWGIGVVLLGYLAGSSYAVIERAFGRAVALVVVALILIGLVAWWVRRYRRAHRSDQGGPTGGAA